jgi:hypothetical protein
MKGAAGALYNAELRECEPNGLKKRMVFRQAA